MHADRRPPRTHMQALICGVASHVDPAVRKTCVQVLQALVAAWLPGSQEAFPGVRRWVLEKVAGEALLRGVLQSALDLRVRACASAFFTPPPPPPPDAGLCVAAERNPNPQCTMRLLVVARFRTAAGLGLGFYTYIFRLHTYIFRLLDSPL